MLKGTLKVSKFKILDVIVICERFQVLQIICWTQIFTLPKINFVEHRGAKKKDIVSHIVPAPNRYTSCPLQVYRTAAPKYTMRKNTVLPFDKTLKPAPNRYAIKNSHLKKHTGFRFGNLHSDFRSIYFTHEDIA